MIPWTSYPRPQLQRKEWLCLNGRWRFQNGSILVPFCPESVLSGRTGAVPPGTELIYERDFAIPDGWRGSRILLHFGAVSRACAVSVNGKEVCRHDNAYLPFSADITDALIPGTNHLRVRAVNDLSPRYPWGKQRLRRGGMWYTPVSGIWQTVWLEPVPGEYVRGLRIETDLTHARVQAEGVSHGVLMFEGRAIPLRDGTADIQVEHPILWTPETPHLYRFELRCGEDRVSSYFALRTLTAEDGRLCLNGRPYFFNGLLDQGYWSDGLYTPAGPEAFEKDILTMKSLGFNTLRKHIKIEAERFYYDTMTATGSAWSSFRTW